MNRRNFFTGVVSFAVGLVTGTLFKSASAVALNKETDNSGERSFNPYDYSEANNIDVMYIRTDSSDKEFQFCSKEILNRMLVEMRSKGYQISTYYMSPKSFKELKNYEDSLPDHPYDRDLYVQDNFFTKKDLLPKIMQVKIEVVDTLPNDIVVAKSRYSPEYLVVGLINRRTI